MTHHLTIVDVFAERRNGGNPLAVVVGTDPIPDATMQRIATETDYSETSFVNAVPELNGGYAVRIFTPAREIDFAGRPQAIATANIGCLTHLAQVSPVPVSHWIELLDTTLPPGDPLDTH